MYNNTNNVPTHNYLLITDLVPAHLIITCLGRNFGGIWPSRFNERLDQRLCHGFDLVSSPPFLPLPHRKGPQARHGAHRYADEDEPSRSSQPKAHGGWM